MLEHTSANLETWLDDQTRYLESKPLLRVRERARIKAANLAAWEAERQRKFDQAAELSEIGERFSQRTFATFRKDNTNLRAYDAAVAAANTGRPALGLHGPVGTGKSHLAGAVVNACRAAGVPSVFITPATLISRLRSALPDTEPLLEKFARVPVLVLDDLGKEQLTKWSAPLFFEFVNRRYEANLPLVVTCNVDGVSLREHYRVLPAECDATMGAAMIDRILEITNFPWVAMSGESKRW